MATPDLALFAVRIRAPVIASASVINVFAPPETDAGLIAAVGEHLAEHHTPLGFGMRWAAVHVGDTGQRCNFVRRPPDPSSITYQP